MLPQKKLLESFNKFYRVPCPSKSEYGTQGFPRYGSMKLTAERLRFSPAACNASRNRGVYLFPLIGHKLTI